MSKYYEITQSEADLIGRFSIDSINDIDPYSVKLTNGNYVICVDDVEGCSGHPNIKKVDFSDKVKKDLTDLEFQEQ